VGFLGEEGLDEKGTYTFIIDPLDGTTNFISGLAYFSVSIACLKNEEILCGVTYNPVTDTMYSAEKGKGATKTQAGITTPLQLVEAPLKMSNVNIYFSSNTEVRQKLFKIIEALFSEMRALRVWGSGTLELAQLAENLTNIVIYGKCGAWDVAVAKLLLQEAGGSLTDWQGVPLKLDLLDHDKTYQVLACHPAHVETLVAKIQQAITAG
jgi:myo-inositol-1(or 4)-monophosphatase